MRSQTKGQGMIEIDKKEGAMVLILKDLASGAELTMLPLDKMTKDEIYPGDLVDVRILNGELCLQNRSSLVLRLSRFRRDLNGLLKKLANNKNPLNRVLVLRKNGSPNFWCIPHDEELRHSFFK